MLTTFIPYIASLAMVEGTKFEEPVRVDFFSSFAGSMPGFIWEDTTQYVPPELKDTLSGKDLFDNSVGQLFFTETTAAGTKRTIQWSKGKSNKETIHEVSTRVCLACRITDKMSVFSLIDRRSGSSPAILRALDWR